MHTALLHLMSVQKEHDKTMDPTDQNGCAWNKWELIKNIDIAVHFFPPIPSSQYKESDYVSISLFRVNNMSDTKCEHDQLKLDLVNRAQIQ